MVHGSIQAAYDLYVTVCNRPMPDARRHQTDSLAGASIIVTRPVADATALARAAKSRGAVVVRLPGVVVKCIDDSEATWQTLIAAKSASIWIFTSPNAVRFCRHLLGEGFTSTVPVAFAVGAGTRRALARQRLSAFAPNGAQNSEGLLAEAELAKLHGKTIAIIDAPGGRDLLAPALRMRGAQVERIAVYQRLPPRLNARDFAKLAGAPRPWISLVSSSVILNHLLAALPAELRIRWQREAMVVSSARLAGEARQLGFTDVHEAKSALTADLLDGAERVLSRHRI